MSKSTKPAKGKSKAKAATPPKNAKRVLDKAERARLKALAKSNRELLKLDRKRAEALEAVNDKSRPKAERKAARRFLDETTANPEVPTPAPAESVDAAAPAATPGKSAGKPVGAKGSARAADALKGESEVEYQHRKLAERKAAEPTPEETPAPTPHAVIEAADKVLADANASPGAIKSAKAAKAKAKAALKAEVAADVATLEDKPEEAAAAASVVEVETEHGREFVAGAVSSLESHGIVAAVEPTVIERDWLDRPIVAFVNDKGEVKRKGYTRVTTYIDCLEDKSALDKWKTRTLLEGVALDLDPYRADGELDLADSLIGQARRLSHEHDKALKRIAKRQDKGELVLGQFGLLREEADKAWKDGLNALVELGLDLGGVHERANKGTDLHALTERYDRGELTLDSEELTEVDRADLKAYADKMAELGIEHVAQEQFVVIDELGVGGTLDRMALYKPKGAGRRVRVVADIKTGRIDYSAGKIGMQVLTYARGKAIDPEVEDGTGRIDLKASKTVGLLIHLPQGEARCEVYELDLTLAARGLRLAGEVREWRNAGKRTYNVKAPLVPEVAR